MKTFVKSKYLVIFKTFVLTVTLLFGFTGCNVTDLKPIDTSTPEAAFSTPVLMGGAVLSMYNAMQDGNNGGMAGWNLLQAENRTANLIDAANFTPSVGFQQSMLANDGVAFTIWNAAYAAINRANIVTKGVTDNPGVVSAALSDQYLGEARFVRALCYWHLVNWFARPYVDGNGNNPGVPLRLTANFGGEPPALERSTVAQVYTQIEADLVEAVAKLPIIQPAQGNQTSNYNSVSRATRGAALALLTRVHLHKGEWNNVITRGNQYIALNRYSLEGTPSAVFAAATPANSAEAVFYIAHSTADNPNTNNSLFNNLNSLGLQRYSLGPDLIAAFPVGDTRLSSLSVVTSATRTWTTKYRSSTLADWVPHIRHPEVLLNLAEALVQQSGTVDVTALGYVNSLRTRAGVTAYVVGDFANAAAFRTAILLERRLELYGEGKYFFDLLRTSQGVSGKVTSAGAAVPAVPWNSNFVIFPIPQVELDRNPGIRSQQNPGY